MITKDKYIKCPYCGLNYIKEGEVCCKVCYAQNSNIRKEVYEKRAMSGYRRKWKTRTLIFYESRKKLLDFMKRKGFVGFLRTENFDNFIRIYKSGSLKSRFILERERIQFTDNADPEVMAHTSDYIKKKVRFYLRCKTPTNYGAFFSFGQRNPVVLVFDEDLIYHQKSIFADGNAMSGQTFLTDNADYALKNYDWDEIFGFGPFDKDNFRVKNNRNAEFLYPFQVSMSYVKKIYFKYRPDMERAISILGNDPRFELKPEMFF